MRINIAYWTAPHLHDLGGLWRLLRIEDDLLARDRILDWLWRKTRNRPWVRDFPVTLTIGLIGTTIKRSLTHVVFWGEHPQ